MKKIIWVLVNCNTITEAQKIGNTILKKRLISCFDILPRHSASFFWPPKTGRIASSKGATLALETFKDKYYAVAQSVASIHGDKLPFVGFIEIHGTSGGYQNWMRGELR